MPNITTGIKKCWKKKSLKNISHQKYTPINKLGRGILKQKSWIKQFGWVIGNKKVYLHNILTYLIIKQPIRERTPNRSKVRQYVSGSELVTWDTMIETYTLDPDCRSIEIIPADLIYPTWGDIGCVPGQRRRRWPGTQPMSRPGIPAWSQISHPSSHYTILLPDPDPSNDPVYRGCHRVVMATGHQGALSLTIRNKCVNPMDIRHAKHILNFSTV